MTDLRQIEISKLTLDYKNPRLSEFGLDSKSREEIALTILWDEMAVNELMYSIVSNGYWEYEPVIAIENEGGFIVIEGNRRLAAVKLIHNPALIDRKIPSHIIEKVTANLLDKTNTLPVIVVGERKDAWKYIGFKHVNGPAKWGSYAKAKYIAEIHNDYGVPIEDIAYQVGDTNKTAQKLYQGLMILEQANNTGVYKYEDIQANRIYFSHLYTGIQREGIKKFLDLKEATEESKSPVPEENLKNLGELLEWLYGNKKNETQPIIKSQNPDLKYLDEVLQSKEATYALRAGEPLAYCHELSRSSDAIFEENLLAAKRSLQKARAHLSTGYKGEESLVKVAGSVADLADDLYREMETLYKARKESGRGSRMTE
jgi:DNA-binding transcriptional MerR regulator